MHAPDVRARIAAWARTPSAGPALFALAYTVAIGVLMARHEMWRDEIMAWLMARDARTPLEVFELIKYEGHPSLWYLVMWPLTRLTWNPAAMQAAHALIAGAAAFVLARWSPFPVVVRAALAAGYLFAYEWGVVARNYALSVLLLFVFCALYRDRWRRFPLLALVLGLLCHTNVHSLILAVVFLAVLVVEFPVAYVGRWHGAERALGRVVLGVLLVLAGAGSAVLQMKPPPDSGTAREWVLEWQPDRVEKVASIVPRAYFPVPLDRVNFWNTSRLIQAGNAAPPRAWYAVPLDRSVAIAAGILGAGVLFFLKRPWMAVPYVAGSLALCLFFYVKYFGSLRNHGFLFLLFVVCLWLSTCYEPWRAGRAWADGPADAWDRHRVWVLLAVALVHVSATFVVVRHDWSEPFSNSRAASEWIRAAFPQRDAVVFAGDQSGTVQTVVGYVPLERMFYLDRKEFGARVIQDRRFQGRVRPDLAERLRDLAQATGRPVVVVLSYVLTPAELAATGTRLLQGFDTPSATDENYFVYSYAGPPAASAPSASDR